MKRTSHCQNTYGSKPDDVDSFAIVVRVLFGDLSVIRNASDRSNVRASRPLSLRAPPRPPASVDGRPNAKAIRSPSNARTPMFAEKMFDSEPCSSPEMSKSLPRASRVPVRGRPYIKYSTDALCSMTRIRISFSNSSSKAIVLMRFLATRHRLVSTNSLHPMGALTQRRDQMPDMNRVQRHPGANPTAQQANRQQRPLSPSGLIGAFGRQARHQRRYQPCSDIRHRPGRNSAGLAARVLPPGENNSIYNADKVADDDDAALYPIEFLNSLLPSGVAPHHLDLKTGGYVMPLRNLNPAPCPLPGATVMAHACG